MNPDRRPQIVDSFFKSFGSHPSYYVRAPGRVDLMGSHTDYNLGQVLTLPIGRDTWIAACPRMDSTVQIRALNFDEESSFDLNDITHDEKHFWSNYVRGVASILKAEGLELRGFNGVIHSTVPIGSGLSSSAALECATATMFEALGGWRLDPVKKAELCQRAENQFVGVNCGILDQFTSCVGQKGCALMLDCRDLSSRPAQLAQDIQIVICDTRYKRKLSGSEYGTRRNQCMEGARLLGAKFLCEVSLKDFEANTNKLSPEVAKRCRFILEENIRVGRLADALVSNDRNAIGQLTKDSFHGARDLYEIGVPAMESMMEAMLSGPGVIGARQAGAGFGGCMVAFVEAPQVEKFVATVGATYSKATQLQPEIYPVDAAAGAGVF